MEVDATTNAKILTELELYNIIMSMAKQAIGEILGYAGSSSFAYVDSTYEAPYPAPA